MRIVFFEINPNEKEIFEKALSGEDLYFYEHKLDKENLPNQKDADVISVFVGSKIDKEILTHFPNLKYISTRSMGYDHIDLGECKKRNILVSNAPHYGGNTVAEWTFALILNLLRKVYQSIDQIKESGDFNLENLQGTELAGKTIGVIGTGRIGKEVVKIAKSFGMKVVGYDVNPDYGSTKSLGFEYKNNLNDLLAVSDVISLHVNYTKETHHLIGQENIKMCKKGSYLINTSRGPVLETEALVWALNEKILAGAGLDVLEEEGAIKDEFEFLIKGRMEEHNLKTILADHILMKMDNVLITPHNAFNSKEAVERIIDATIENINGFAKGELINLVSN
jgi:D-lactate dehydrogenase